MKTWKYGIFGILAIIALAFIACDGDNGKDDPPQPHESTITAFSKTITVKGDGSIATADFNTAKGKLEEAMVALNSANEDNIELQAKFATMLNRTGFAMIIGTGNATPNADANKSMTIGVDYLLANDMTTIALAILSKVNVDNAFAE